MSSEPHYTDRALSVGHYEIPAEKWERIEREMRTRYAKRSEPIEAGSSGGAKFIFGRAIVYGQIEGPWSQAGRSGTYYRQIQSGALGASVRAGHDVIGSYVDPETPLARGRNGSLKLIDSASSLDFEIPDDSTELFADVYELIKREVLIGVDAKLEQITFDWRNEGGRQIGAVKSAFLKEICLDPFLTYRDGIFIAAAERAVGWDRSRSERLERARWEFQAALAKGRQWN